MSLTLVIGNKNYSSWSMRPWIALRAEGIAFDEVVIPLYTGPVDKQKIIDRSRAGKVPILLDGAITVWDSLAIIEYAAERFPDSKLWPGDPVARAQARSISAEMHSGFAALRDECGMNLHRPVAAKRLSAQAKADIARIEESWRESRARYGADGPFLFGQFSAADAMYAPVVCRFHIYAVDVAPDTRSYMNAMMALPAMKSWVADALAETWVIPKFEDA